MPILGIGLAVTSCLGPPPLTDATNNIPFSGSIPLHDVVQRVKCDLAEALYERVYKSPMRARFAWMQNWTAKADLTLEVDETGGITPSFSFLKPLPNAFILGTGPNSINTATGAVTNVVSATAQNFILGASVNVSGSATRTETLSFNIALAELKDWKEARKKMIAEGVELAGIYSCEPKAITDVQAGLDLKSWLDEVLKPVELNDLQPGIHPTPQTATSAATPKSSKAAGAPAGPGGAALAWPGDLVGNPERKALLDLKFANELIELQVPYDLDSITYKQPPGATNVCTIVPDKYGQSLIRPPSYPNSTQNSLLSQSISNAQTAQSNAAQILSSTVLDRRIKNWAQQTVDATRKQALLVQNASQLAADYLLATCELNANYVEGDCVTMATDTSSEPIIKIERETQQISVGKTAKFKITVSSSGAATSESVSLKDNKEINSASNPEGTLATGMLTGGAVEIETVRFTQPGDHAITVEYSGRGSKNVQSKTSIDVQVFDSGSTPTTTKLEAAPNPSRYGESVKFTVTVSPPPARGELISLSSPRDNLGKSKDPVVTTNWLALDDSGVATVEQSLTMAGSRILVATYYGNKTFAGSSSNELTQMVQSGDKETSVKLDLLPNPAIAGQLVTMTATVVDKSGSPTKLAHGGIAFIADGKLLNVPASSDGISMPISKGEATYKTSLIANQGQHSLVAIYGGDKDFKPATSAPKRLYVVKSLSAVKYVAVQLSPYYCGEEQYSRDLDNLFAHQVEPAEEQAAAAKKNAALSTALLTPDPPYESIGQSMNFVVTAGGSLSPNWSFARWKGPSNGGSLATMSGIRTHSLNIAMGPVNQTTEVTRVLDNAATRQAIQGLQ